MNIKKAKIMAQLKETMETLKLLPIFAYLGSVINSKGDCSQEIKRRLGLSKAAIEELEKVMKSKDVSLETKAEIIHTFYSQLLRTDVKAG